MQATSTKWLKGSPEPKFSDRRHLTHKRLDRWVRLQQFVYGLGDDYAYAGRFSQQGGRILSQTLVKVGWMSWYGEGRGADKQHSLAISLLETNDALSANASKVWWLKVRNWLRWKKWEGMREVAHAGSLE